MKTELQKEIIRTLLNTLNDIQEKLEPEGLRSNDISYSNDLYDEISVMFLEEVPDGDYQVKIFEKGEKITFNEAKESILTRIKNICYL